MTEDERSVQPGAFVRVWRIALRLVVVIVLGIGLGLGLYFGVPRLYRSAIEPMQSNARRIADLELALAQQQAQARERAAQLGDRIVTLEGRLATQIETLSTVEVQLGNLVAIQDEQGAVLQDLEEVQDALDNLAQDLVRTGAQVEEIDSALAELEIPARELGDQVQLVRAMTLLVRARLWLVQDNLGLAAEDIEAARNVLATVHARSAEEVTGVLDAIIERLDMALEDIRVAPIVAADELEIAWKLLVATTDISVPEPILVVEPTPTEAFDE